MYFQLITIMNEMSCSLGTRRTFSGDHMFLKGEIYGKRVWQISPLLLFFFFIQLTTNPFWGQYFIYSITLVTIIYYSLFKEIKTDLSKKINFFWLAIIFEYFKTRRILQCTILLEGSFDLLIHFFHVVDNLFFFSPVISVCIFSSDSIIDIFWIVFCEHCDSDSS